MNQIMTGTEISEKQQEELKPWTTPRVEVFSVIGETAKHPLDVFNVLSSS